MEFSSFICWKDESWQISVFLKTYSFFNPIGLPAACKNSSSQIWKQQRIIDVGIWCTRPHSIDRKKSKLFSLSGSLVEFFQLWRIFDKIILPGFFSKLNWTTSDRRIILYTFSKCNSLVSSYEKLRIGTTLRDFWVNLLSICVFLTSC